MVHLCCASSKKNVQAPADLAATALQPFGRYIINKDQNLELISSAVHFGFSFEGTACQVFASIPNKNGHNYLQYELDGVYQKRLKILGGDQQSITIMAQKSGRHTVWIYKATEAHTGPIFIRKVRGARVKAIPNANAPAIEFIGNSITCGAAADASEIPCGIGEYHDHHNAYYSYGARVARALKANFIISSVSGIGVYRNWNSDGPAMPQVYEKVDFQEKNSQMWNFKTYMPRVVSIALGTNDFSNGDGVKKRLPFDSAAFIKNYVRFIQLVKTKYPRAVIALLGSPMIGGDNGRLLQTCLERVKQNIDAANPSDKRVALYFFTPMVARGCSGHPSVEDHAILAAGLTPFFRNLLR